MAVAAMAQLLQGLSDGEEVMLSFVMVVMVLMTMMMMMMSLTMVLMIMTLIMVMMVLIMVLIMVILIVVLRPVMMTSMVIVLVVMIAWAHIFLGLHAVLGFDTSLYCNTYYPSKPTRTFDR